MEKVIIVGGGISGLTAAKRLADSKQFDVTLLEADNRVGGRVHTTPLGDHFVENGAQWVHGKQGNDVFAIASSLDLVDDKRYNMNYSSTQTCFITSSGNVLDSETHERVRPSLHHILEESSGNETQGSVGEWAIRQFENQEKIAPIDPQNPVTGAAVLDWIHRLRSQIDGSDNWFQSSLQGQKEYQSCPENHTICWKSPACYASLVSLIVNDTPTFAPVFQPNQLPDWIQLQKQVVKIEVVEEFRGKFAVQVTCSDGFQYRCDHLICTVSLGVLKHSHKAWFSPPLPPKKVAAIENLGIGCVNKVHFDFGTKWWPDSIFRFNLLWDDVQTAPQYWRSDIDDSTLRQNIDGLPVWCRSSVGFYEVPSHPTALVAWTFGPAARFVETLSDDEVKKTFMKVLRRFFKNHVVPEPVDFCRSKWYSNQYTRGSYSFRQMESEANNVWATDLADPVVKGNKPLICFAGEATHSHYYSTVHGAYETGIREADRLLAHKRRVKSLPSKL